MELTEFAKALKEQNDQGGGFQIHLNSSELNESSKRCTGVEFSELYFTKCGALNEGRILYFGNVNREPIGQKEDGTNLFSMEINSSLFIDVNKIEAIEELQEAEDWFEFLSSRVINLYMQPENSMNGNRNVLTIGFMK